MTGPGRACPGRAGHARPGPGMSGPGREAKVARGRGSRVADFARGRGSRGAGRRGQRPPATLPTLTESARRPGTSRIALRRPVWPATVNVRTKVSRVIGSIWNQPADRPGPVWPGVGVRKANLQDAQIGTAHGRKRRRAGWRRPARHGGHRGPLGVEERRRRTLPHAVHPKVGGVPAGADRWDFPGAIFPVESARTARAARAPASYKHGVTFRNSHGPEIKARSPGTPAAA